MVSRIDSRVAGANHGVGLFPSLYRVNADGSLSWCSDSSSRRELGDVIRQMAQLYDDAVKSTVMPVTIATTAPTPV